MLSEPGYIHEQLSLCGSQHITFFLVQKCAYSCCQPEDGKPHHTMEAHAPLFCGKQYSIPMTRKQNTQSLALKAYPILSQKSD